MIGWGKIVAFSADISRQIEVHKIVVGPANLIERNVLNFVELKCRVKKYMYPGLQKF